MMKLLVTLGTAAALTLGACTVEAPPAEVQTETTTTTTEPTVAEPVADDELEPAALVRLTLELMDVDTSNITEDDAALDSAGRSMCDFASTSDSGGRTDNYVSTDELTYAGLELMDLLDISASDAGSVAGAMFAAYCPDFGTEY